MRCQGVSAGRRPAPGCSSGALAFEARLLLGLGGLRRANFPRGLDVATFARRAGRIMADVNHFHPFREGNGRAQPQYLEQLAAQAGDPAALRLIEPKRGRAALAVAHFGGESRALEGGRPLGFRDFFRLLLGLLMVRSLRVFVTSWNPAVSSRRPLP